MELLMIGCFLCHVYADVRDTRASPRAAVRTPGCSLNWV